jgi:hypothetical protein
MHFEVKLIDQAMKIILKFVLMAVQTQADSRATGARILTHCVWTISYLLFINYNTLPTD